MKTTAAPPTEMPAIAPVLSVVLPDIEGGGEEADGVGVGDGVKDVAGSNSGHRSLMLSKYSAMSSVPHRSGIQSCAAQPVLLLQL